MRGSIPRCDDLFVLGRNVHGRHADELELREGYNALGKEAVNNVDSDPEGLRQKVIAKVDLQEPIDERSPHVPGNLRLPVDVSR